ncbi:hypothetical protein T484DRAFT_1835861 [Baffinella frigidus]|nr:hypothetical protein T484DRAFT_1835861 [Cryptophyta sp. CCMP2293]
MVCAPSGGTGVVVEDEKPKAEEVKGWDQARVQQWAGEVQLPGSLFDEEAVTATFSGVDGKAAFAVTATFSGVDGKALWGMSELTSALRKLRGNRYPVALMRVLGYNKDQWHFLALGVFAAPVHGGGMYFLALGVFAATVHGGVMPSFAFIFSAMLSMFFRCGQFSEGLRPSEKNS